MTSPIGKLKACIPSGKSEREARRALSIQKIIEKGREGGLPTAEIEKGVNNFRGAYLLADAVAQFGRVR